MTQEPDWENISRWVYDYDGTPYLYIALDPEDRGGDEAGGTPDRSAY